MATVITIDGSSHTGTYKVRCDCGEDWIGRGQALGAFEWNPAGPIAESVAHFQGEHPASVLDIRFSDRFSAWLLSYWEHQMARTVREHQRVQRLGKR